MDAKALLDSLMGDSRNQSLKEQKKNKGNNFKKDSICKHYLLGFCPAHELADTKLSRFKGAPTSQCQLTHSDAMKKEFEDHPDREKLRIEYGRQLLRALGKYMSDADASAEKERGNVKRNEVEIPGSTHLKKMPKHVDEEITRLTKDMSKLMTAAEEIAQKGDVEGSKFKVKLAEEIKTKIEELKADYTVTVEKYREEMVCDVCGQRLEKHDPKNPQRHEAHFTGVVHCLFLKIRAWHKDIQSKVDPDGDYSGSSKEPRHKGPSMEEDPGYISREQANADSHKGKPRDSYDRRRSRSRSRSRSPPERERTHQDHYRERDQDRDRVKDRERGADRGQFEDRDRVKDPDRGGDRGHDDRHGEPDRSAQRDRDRLKDQEGGEDRGQFEDRDRFRDYERGGDRGQYNRHGDRDRGMPRDRDNFRDQERGEDRGRFEDRDRFRDQYRGGDHRDNDRYGDRDRDRYGDRGRDREPFGDQERGRDRGHMEDRDRFGDQERSGYSRDRGRYADRDRPGRRDRDRSADRGSGDRGYLGDRNAERDRYGDRDFRERDRYGDREQGSRDRDWGWNDDKWRDRSPYSRRG